jgi:hypothetical protein
MRRVILAAFALVAAQATACAVPQRPAKLPERERSWIAVLSGEMPEAIQNVARHSWIVRNVRGVPYLRRWELLGTAARSWTKDPFAYFGQGDVAVHGIVEGSDEDMARISRCLDDEVDAYTLRHPTYFPMPGPNSNTFVAEALRHCGIHVELPSTAVGRDYRGIVGAGVTESGTGVQLESIVVGARVGLREGVEGHILGLALGVHAWPPGITVPMNPGRVGIDLDGHKKPDPSKRSRDDEWSDQDVDRRYGVGIAQMLVRVAHVKHAEDAGGLAQRATVELNGHAVLTKKRFGPAIGADLELGMGFPAGFAYAFHVYPLGAGCRIGPTGYVGVFGGFGTSGVSARVVGGFEIPIEARLELDAGPLARLGLRAGTTWIPGVDSRRGGSVLPFGDEMVLGTFMRFGKTRSASWGSLGRGVFFGLERHEVMHSYWLGFTLGAESDFGG